MPKANKPRGEWRLSRQRGSAPDFMLLVAVSYNIYFCK